MSKKKVIGIAIITLAVTVGVWIWLNTGAEGEQENVTVRYSASFELTNTTENLPVENIALAFPYPRLTIEPEKVIMLGGQPITIIESEMENLSPPVIEESTKVLPKGVVKSIKRYENQIPERGWTIKAKNVRDYAGNIRIPTLIMSAPELNVGEKIEVKSKMILPENLSENLTLTNYYFENFPAEDPVPVFFIEFGDSYDAGIDVTVSFEIETARGVSTIENVSRSLEKLLKPNELGYVGVVLKK